MNDPGAMRGRAPVPILPFFYRRAVEAVRAVRLLARGKRWETSLPRPRAAELAALVRAQRLPPGPAGPSPDAVDLVGLRARLAKQAPRAKVVGFDIFDTLLSRRVEPEWVKTAVSQALWRRLRRLLEEQDLPSAAEVRRRRSELEQVISDERVARGEDNEVDYARLVPRWVGTWVPPGVYLTRLTAEVREVELDLESRALFALPGVADLLAWLRRDLGKRVIYVSDMYHSKDDLDRLLEGCGLGAAFDAGYVSNEHGKRKATGRLFAEVLSREGLRPEDLLFVGDNPSSDLAEPRRLGIPALLLDDPRERRRRHSLHLLHRAADRNPYWRAHLVEEALGAGAGRPTGDDPARRLGRLLGPVLSAFVLDVMERCDRLRVDRIFFLAREGLVLSRLHRILRAAEEHLSRPPDRYLLVSRASTFLPSMRELSWEELRRFWWQYPRQTLNGLLRNLSLPAEPFVGLARSCGLHDPDSVIEGAEHDEAFQQFLGSRPVRLAFLEHRDRARALLRRYLEQLGFFGHRSVAFVDVGWKGSMQDNIVRAFADDPGCPEVHGLYLGFLDHGLPQQPRSTKHGYLADSRRGDPEEYDFFRNTPVVEMATTAAHGSAVGYRPGGGDPRGSVPVLRHHDIEKALAEGHFLAVQEAIYAYGRELARVRPLLPFTAEELRPGVLDAFLRYVRYPTREEAAEFLRFSHVESFGVDEVTTFGLDIDRRLLLRPWRAIPELSRALDRNLWREGVVRRSGIPMANFAYDLYRTLRGR